MENLKLGWIKSNWKGIFILSILTVIIFNASLSGDNAGDDKLSRYAVFNLKKIDTNKAKDFLLQIGVENISELPKPNTILVTAEPADLLRAKSLLKLIDSEKNYGIRKIKGVENIKDIPRPEVLTDFFDDIEFGTFFDRPVADVDSAIVDKFGDDIIIVAPENSVSLVSDKVMELMSSEGKAKKEMEKLEKQAAEQKKVEKPQTEEKIEKETKLQEKQKADKKQPEKEVEEFAPKSKGQEDDVLDILLQEMKEAEEELKKTEKKPEITKLEPEEERVIEDFEDKAAEPNKTEQKEVAKKPEVERQLEIEEAKKKIELEKAEVEKEPETAKEGRYEVLKEDEDELVTPLWKIEESKVDLKKGRIVFGPNKPAEKKEPRDYGPEKFELEDGTLDLALPEKLRIEDLLGLVGQYLNLDYMYDPTVVKGEVALKLRGPIKVKDLYPLLESVLKFKGYVMSRKGNLVTIVPKEEVFQIDPELIKDHEELEVGDVMVTRVYHLDYVDTGDARNLLEGMQLGTEINEIPEKKTIIVTEYAYRMKRVEELLNLIDKPGKKKEFRFRQLQYTMAENMAPKLEELARNLEEISITVAEPDKEEPKTARERAAEARKRRSQRGRPQPDQQQEAEKAGRGVYLDYDERTNMVLMIGLQEDLDVVERLIDTLDVKKLDLRVLRSYEIQNVGADEVVDKLAELGIISEGTDREMDYDRSRSRSTRQRRSPRDRPEQTAAAQTTGEEYETPLTEEPDVVIIESTNSLLVNATAEQHAQIATIVAYVDSEPLEESIPYVVYPLENQDPEELAGVLTDLIKETVSEQQEKDKDQKVVRTTKTMESRTEEDIVIVPDPMTYSLIVYANKKNQQWISSLITQLDEYRPQVLLDVTLVEITKDDLFKSDIDLLTKSYGGRTGTLGQLNSQEFSTSRLMDAKSGLGGSNEDPEYLTVFLNSSKTQILLDLVERKSYGRIMSRPKLLVNDNQEGEIKTQNTISVAQVSSDTQIPEQGSAITSTDVSFNDYESGVTLKIKPHISKGDMLRLEIELNRTDFELQENVEITTAEGKQEFPSPPNRLSTDVTTVGTIPDKQTIILGGLETIDQDKGHSKVPILGDIPLIGGLFRTISNSDNQSRLYVFVRASIIRPGDQIEGIEDIKDVSNKNRKAFEDLEGSFQQMEDWPGVEPEPMDPVNVLEKDFDYQK